jgi:hypothetical protein
MSPLCKDGQQCRLYVKHLIDYNLFVYFWVHTINLCLLIMCSIEFQGCNYMEDHTSTVKKAVPWFFADTINLEIYASCYFRVFFFIFEYSLLVFIIVLFYRECYLQDRICLYPLSDQFNNERKDDNSSRYN